MTDDDSILIDQPTHLSSHFRQVLGRTRHLLHRQPGKLFIHVPIDELVSESGAYEELIRLTVS